MTDYESGIDETADTDLGNDDAGDMPRWERDRISKITKQKHEQRERAEAAEQRAAMLEGRLQALEARLSEPQRPQKPEREPQGLDKFQTVDELKAVAKRLHEYQFLAVDPDASAEARAEAKRQLAQIDDLPGTLADIQVRMANIVAGDRIGGFEKQLSEREAQSAGRNALTQNLIAHYGMEAVDPTSDLNKKAAEVIQGWINDGDVTQDNAGSDFIAKLAFKEAASRLKKSRGGRGSDPRHSAVELGGSGRGPANGDLIASLKKRGEDGDWKAARKAQDLQVDNFLTHLASTGQITGGS